MNTSATVSIDTSLVAAATAKMTLGDSPTATATTNSSTVVVEKEKKFSKKSLPSPPIKSTIEQECYPKGEQTESKKDQSRNENPEPEIEAPCEEENTTAPPPADVAITEKPKSSISSKHVPKIDLPSPESETDGEIRLAMEMAIAAAQNPHLSPAEIQKLVGEKNAQAKMIDEFSKQNEQKIKQNQLKVRELQQQQQRQNNISNGNTSSSWWTAAAKKAEEMKDRAERHLYADQIGKDESILELRKTIKILKKTIKAHRLQGNRVDTRHVFKRQRMEKKLIAVTERLTKTQHVFTNSSYNVQEYLKAAMRASKKWRKVGTDEELMLEAQLSRNMHQMLALEKQKVKCKKNTKELKKYLQRCKGWLSDKKAFCEMNVMTLEATQNSMMHLYGETLQRQDRLIVKLQRLEEFRNVDLSTVDLSHVQLSSFDAFFPKAKDPTRSAALEAMRGLPMKDSIRVKKDHLERAAHEESGGDATAVRGERDGDAARSKAASGQAASRKLLVNEYYKQEQQKQLQHQDDDTDLHPPAGAPELYVLAKDDVSVSSHLSDPDDDDDLDHDANDDDDNDDKYKQQQFPANYDQDDDDSDGNFGNDAPWMASARSAALSGTGSASGDSSGDDDAFRTTARAMGLRPTDEKPPAETTESLGEAYNVSSAESDEAPTVSSTSDEGKKEDSTVVAVDD